MKLASIGPAGQERPVWVSEDGERYLDASGSSWREALDGDFFGEEMDAAAKAAAEDWHAIAGERFGPPIPQPSKIVAVGLNYMDHALEQGKKPPEAPLLFAKAPTCLAGHGDPILIPPQESQVDAEAELAIVIRSLARRVSPEEARGRILGYTIMNDVSGRSAQYGDKQWFRGKSFDTFGPCGPWIVLAEDLPEPHGLAIRGLWNGNVMQESGTDQLIFGVFDLVSYISRQMTLCPGDIIATGTPAGVGVFRNPAVFLKPGDRVRIEIERIGTLENPVAAG
jgi:2-keto-4-pentenoate hydratase/2-oxohepta-3-ene-1,7-dioic acid hydratase in catechol pathway